MQILTIVLGSPLKLIYPFRKLLPSISYHLVGVVHKRLLPSPSCLCSHASPCALLIIPAVPTSSLSLKTTFPFSQTTLNYLFLMGNTTSCAPSILSGGSVVKVLSKDGAVQMFARSVKAVELMLENPRHFVCDATDLKVGHRIPGLAADEALERRHLYFLLPIEMLYSVLTDDEMDVLTFLASKVMKIGGTNHIGKIFPMFGEFCIFPSESKGFDSTRDSKQGERYSKQRSWKPALDTIDET